MRGYVYLKKNHNAQNIGQFDRLNSCNMRTENHMLEKTPTINTKKFVNLLRTYNYSIYRTVRYFGHCNRLNSAIAFFISYFAVQFRLGEVFVTHRSCTANLKKNRSNVITPITSIAMPEINIGQCNGWNSFRIVNILRIYKHNRNSTFKEPKKRNRSSAAL